MAIKIQGTNVVNDSRELENITNLKTINSESILGVGDISITSPNDSTISISAGSGLTTGGSFTTNQSFGETITINHEDTSSSSSSSNSGNTFIQDVFIDSFGHVTSFGTNTITDSDLGLDSNDYVRHASLGIGTNAGGFGDIRATGNITAFYSDDRLKTRLGGLDDALDKVDTLDVFYYEPNETAQDLGYEKIKDVGVSAQQVQMILPEIVAPAPIDDEYLTVRYEKMVPLLLQAIKELRQEVNSLKETKNDS